MIKLPANIARCAAHNLSLYFGYDPYGGHKIFWTFVGIENDPDRWLDNSSMESGDWVWSLPEDVYERVLLLASPHHKAIITAMIVNGRRIDLTLHTKS